ncbi:HNH endonuclease family protein [Mycoplasma sp. 394]
METKEFNIKELVDKTNSGDIISDITLQREIIYSSEKQSLVIDTLMKKLVLPPIILWKLNDNKLEVIDGKQRIHSIKKYINNEITWNGQNFNELGKSDKAKQDEFSKMKISAVIHTGTEEEKRTAFYRINTCGVPLSEFEVINGLVDNKFIQELNQYVKDNKKLRNLFGETNSRGKYQFIILKLVSKLSNVENIAKWMKNQESFSNHSININKMLRFIEKIFPQINNKYKDIPLLLKLADKYKDKQSQILQNAVQIKAQITLFYKDKDLMKIIDTKQKEKYFIELLELKTTDVDKRRFFNLEEKETLFNKNKINKPDSNLVVAKCAKCLNEFEKSNLEMDHIIPWSLGGPTNLSNAQLLCKSCNSSKGNKENTV